VGGGGGKGGSSSSKCKKGSHHSYYAYKNTNAKLKLTVGPASKEVPESAIAAQPPAQKPDNDRCRI